MIKAISIKDFTAFKELDAQLSEGINIFIGANSTGKTHLLKLMYALIAVDFEEESSPDPSRILTEKLRGVFKPEEKIGRLCRNDAEKANIQLQTSSNKSIEIAFSSDMDEVAVTGADEVESDMRLPVFIPPKEILSSFPGFTSLYLQREIAVDETYFDLCLALETPKLKEGPSRLTTGLLKTLGKACDGEFLLMKQKRFYYKPSTGRMLEAELAAEGFRKLGMLQRLLQNGRINPGVAGPLFWDEPESNRR